MGHIRNYYICNCCGKWFHKSRGYHREDDEFTFCSGPCLVHAIYKAEQERDCGGGFEPDYWIEDESFRNMKNTFTPINIAWVEDICEGFGLVRDNLFDYNNEKERDYRGAFGNIGDDEIFWDYKDYGIMAKMSDKQKAILKNMRMVCEKHATEVRKRYMKYAHSCLLGFKNLYVDMLENKKQFKVTGFKINYVHGNIEFKFKDLINNVHGEVKAFPCCNVEDSPSMEEDLGNTMTMYIRDDFGNMTDLWEPDADFERRYPKYVEELEDMTERSLKSASQEKAK